MITGFAGKQKAYVWGWLIRTSIICCLLGLFSLAIPSSLLQLRADESPNPIPLMAYYYIWFDESSWDRAKTDYPILGRYSSDDEAVMLQHILWAKEAGIDGFIVSWKSTFQLDSRLESLMTLAAENDFQLWIIYQGLDFSRQPLPIERIENDLEHFLNSYAEHLAFSMYDKPIIIWSGTWEFSREEIELVTTEYRDDFYILATERNNEGYLRLADIVDGNAYYWSSVNPATFDAYLEKLSEMGELVHETGGLWVAPAAPGFDARLLGGTSVVERAGGETLRIELDTAFRSNPDAIGLISWNEFSENSHIEPSERYGREALDVLITRETTTVPMPIDVDSSTPGNLEMDIEYPFVILVGAIVFMVANLAFVVYRQFRRNATG
jgi:hypothetical protein